MADFLLTLGRSPLARNVVRKVGLPIPLPQSLIRQRSPWSGNMLQNLVIDVGGTKVRGKSQEVSDPIKSLLLEAGAKIASDSDLLTGICFDASEINSVADLHAVYEFFHARIQRLLPSSHVLIFARMIPVSTLDIEQGTVTSIHVAAQNSLQGFVRSLAKELGSRGITVNLVAVKPDDELSGVARFFLKSSRKLHHRAVLTISW